MRGRRARLDVDSGGDLGKRKEAPAQAGAPPPAHLKGERRRTRGATRGVKGPLGEEAPPPRNPNRVSACSPSWGFMLASPPRPWACCPTEKEGCST
jgi:hypothetical protein